MTALAQEDESNPPCTVEDNVAKYLNTPEVKDALHIESDIPEWTLCRYVYLQLHVIYDVRSEVHIYARILKCQMKDSFLQFSC